MSAILKHEEFASIEGVAPPSVAVAFDELSALRGEMKKPTEPESFSSRP